jgi:O-antigen ligase
LKSLLFYFRIGIFAILISYLIDQNKKILDYFYYSFLVTFSILIIDVFFQYLTGENLFGAPIINERISSFFGDQLILGSYLSRLAPLFIALFVIRLKKSFLEKIFI